MYAKVGDIITIEKAPKFGQVKGNLLIAIVIYIATNNKFLVTKIHEYNPFFVSEKEIKEIQSHADFDKWLRHIKNK